VRAGSGRAASSTGGGLADDPPPLESTWSTLLLLSWCASSRQSPHHPSHRAALDTSYGVPLDYEGELATYCEKKFPGPRARNHFVRRPACDSDASQSTTFRLYSAAADRGGGTVIHPLKAKSARPVF
jgi:hypothetical protein